MRDREAQKNRVFINKRRYAINCDAAKARFMDGVFFVVSLTLFLSHSLSVDGSAVLRSLAEPTQ